MSDELIKVENLSKKFCRDLKRSLWYGLKDIGREVLGRKQNEIIRLRKDEFWALKDINFELKRGECLGIIGRNGAGKTTLLRLLNGLIKPDTGRIAIRGRVGALIALGAGFNPILTGRENIYVNGSVLGLTKKEIDKKIDEIIDFAEIGEFINTPVQNYSSGMQVKLGFSIAAILLKPDVLLIDEILAVGDLSFRNKSMRKMNEFIENANAIIFVSHNLDQIRFICHRVLVMDKGQSTFIGDTDEALIRYENESKDFRVASIYAGFNKYGLFRDRKNDGDRVILNDLGILNQHSQRVNNIGLDDILRVFLDFSINEDCKELYFTLSIVNENKDTDCIWVESYDRNKLEFSNIKAGNYRLIISFPHHHLGPGVYFINYCIGNADNGEQFDHSKSNYSFAVKSDNHYERGIILTDESWELITLPPKNSPDF